MRKIILTNKSLLSNPIFRNKVFWISICVLILIAVTFWTQSRIPALNEKAQIGERINISAIAFDVILPVDSSQPLYERTYKAAVNWAYTNWKGMTFGFLLAAAFITLLQILPRTLGSKNRFLNSLLGLSIGSPLGVCVNCATPIAQGMIYAGTRLETSLSMLLSSPTLNPIVLTIAFSLFSFHVAFIKVLFSVLFIILLVPLLIKFSGVSKSTLNQDVDQKKNHFNVAGISSPVSALTQSWFEALSYTAISLLKNILYIVKITLPLMIVAGLLGSLLVESLPAGSLSELTMTPLTLFAVAAIGVFLPVPIAFDVLIVNILINSGLNIGLAATLLFSLGIFSVYPALIIARTVSIKLSLSFAVSVMFVAMFVGVLTNIVDEDISENAKVIIEKELGKEGLIKEEVVKGSLDEQTAHNAFKEVVDTCAFFNDAYSKAKCFQKVFLNNVFLNSGENICHINSTEQADNKQQQAMDICQQAFSFLTTKKSALAKNDIHLCQSLKVQTLADECMINYIRADSLSYSSLDACLQIKDVQRQRYCGYMIIGDRMILKTTEACELNLSADMKRQCFDNLNAHITSEFGELEKCEALNSDNAKNICRSTVTTLKISRLQDYSICGKLKAAKESRVCKDQVLMYRAEYEGDSSLCSLLLNQQMLNVCQVNVVIRKKQAEIESHKFSLFNGNGAGEINAALVSAKVLAESTKQKIMQPLSWSEIYSKTHDGKLVSLAYAEHFNRNAQKGKIFKKVSAEQLGIKTPWDFDLTDFMEPFVYGKGIASGDYNNDGWPDLVFASSNGLHLYKNKGDGSFEHVQHITLTQQALNTFVVSFVDIDNDGWQDLFLTAYGKGSYFFKNNKGNYANEAFLQLPENNTMVSLAAGFSDWDRDGDLDVVLGNWSYGAEGAFIPEKSQNVWYNNDALKFKPVFPDEALGETLSILLSDINNDGHADLIVGNDRKYPDVFYFSKANGEFSQLTKDEGIIKATSFNTMSYDSADFNNDLQLDIFSTDMFVAAGSHRNYCDVFSVAADKKQCEWLLKASKSVESLNVSWCDSLQNKNRAQCYTAMAIRLAKRYKDRNLCDKVSPKYSAKADFCRNVSRKIKDVKPAENNNLTQHESNKLLINTAQGKFIDATESMGVGNSFWGWSGKAADLDNDGWQDIYIGNGFRFGENNKDIHSNVFYHNQQGEKFIQAEETFGLTNYANTPSYTYVDFDLDGDIDIISSSVMSPPAIFINQGTTGNSVSFILRDNTANKFCIGCKIIISYDNGKQNQVREIKLSGGFMSYDVPVAYFGIGDFDHIDSIKVIWSTGESLQLDKKLLANRRYKITRQADAQL